MGNFNFSEDFVIPYDDSIKSTPISKKDANEKALYAIGATELNESIGPSFLSQVEDYSSLLQRDSDNIYNVTKQQQDALFTEQYQNNYAKFLPDLIDNPDISIEDKKEIMSRYQDMLAEPVDEVRRAEEATWIKEDKERELEVLQQREFLSRVTQIPKETYEEEIDNTLSSLQLFDRLAEGEIVKEAHENREIVDDVLLPFFKNLPEKLKGFNNENLFNKLDTDSKNEKYPKVKFDYGLGLAAELPANKKQPLGKSGSFTSFLFELKDTTEFVINLFGFATETFGVTAAAYFNPTTKTFDEAILNADLAKLRSYDDNHIGGILSQSFYAVSDGLDNIFRKAIINSDYSTNEKNKLLLDLDNTLLNDGLEGLNVVFDTLSELAVKFNFTDRKEKARFAIDAVMSFMILKGAKNKASGFIQNQRVKGRERQRRAARENAKNKIETWEEIIINPNGFANKNSKQAKTKDEIIDLEESIKGMWSDPKVGSITLPKVEKGGALNNIIVSNAELGGNIAMAILGETARTKSGVEVKGGNLGTFFNTKPTDILATFVFNPIEYIEGDLAANLTLHTKLRDLVRPIEIMVSDTYFNPVITNIKQRLKEVALVNKIQNNLRGATYFPTLSPVHINELLPVKTGNLTVGATAYGMRFFARYGKSTTSLIYNTKEAIAKYDYVKDAIIKASYDGQYVIDPVITIERHRYPARGPITYTRDQFENITDAELGGDGITIRWDYQTIYDPIPVELFGNMAISPQGSFLTSNKLSKAIIENDAGGIFGLLDADWWISRGGLVPKWMIGSEFYKSDQFTAITRAYKKGLQSISSLKEGGIPLSSFVTDALDAGSRKNKILSRAEVFNLFRSKNIATEGEANALDAIWRGYITARALSDLNWSISNKVLRESIINQGFTKGLYSNTDFAKTGKYPYIEPIESNFVMNKRQITIQQNVPVIKENTPDMFNDTLPATEPLAEEVVFKVWDQELNDIVPYMHGSHNIQRNIEGVITENRYYDASGKQLVKYLNPKSIDLGNGVMEIVNYGIVDLIKYHIDVLPGSPLAFHEGQNHIMHRDLYFLEKEPTSIIVDGELIDATTKDKKGNLIGITLLEKYREVVGLANSKKEVKETRILLKEEFPGYKITSRSGVESSRDLTSIAENYELSIRATKQRSEHLPERDLTHKYIEDPGIAMLENFQNAARANLTNSYDFALKEAFKRDFPEYLIEGEMPSLSAFKAKFSASLTNKAAYAAAYNILKYKNIMSNPSSAGEAGLSFIMEKGSDISESGLGALENSMNAGIELMSRIIGKEFVKSKWLVEDNAVLEATRRITGKSFTNIANSSVATFFIAFNVLRQFIVQTTQVASWQAGNPHRAVQTTLQLALTMMQTMIDSPAFAKQKGAPTTVVLQAIINKTVDGLTKVTGFKREFTNFKSKYEALQKSQLLVGASMNVMVEAIGNRSEGTKFSPSKLEKAIAPIGKAKDLVVGGTRAIGFDFWETLQRVFFFQRAAEILLERNKSTDLPMATKYLKNPTNVQLVAKAGWEIAGSQTGPGQMGYQPGFMGVLAKFASIMNKLLNVTTQSSASILNKSQRGRLFIGQGLAFGTAGLVFTNYLLSFTDQYDEESFTSQKGKELFKFIKENKQSIEGGLANYFANSILNYGIEDNEDYIRMAENLKEAFDRKELTKKEYEDRLESLEVNINLSKSVSPLGQTGNPLVGIQLINQGYNLLTGTKDSMGQSDMNFPLVMLLKNSNKVLENLQMYYNTRLLTKEEFWNALPRIIAPIISGLNNQQKSNLQEGYGTMFTKSGNDLVVQINKKEALAQLFGVRTKEQDTFYEVLQKLPNERQEIKDEVKKFHSMFTELQRSLIAQGNFRLTNNYTEIDPETGEEISGFILRNQLRHTLLSKLAYEFKVPNLALPELSKQLHSLEMRVEKETGKPSLITMISTMLPDANKRQLNEFESMLIDLKTDSTGPVHSIIEQRLLEIGKWKKRIKIKELKQQEELKKEN